MRWFSLTMLSTYALHAASSSLMSPGGSPSAVESGERGSGGGEYAVMLSGLPLAGVGTVAASTPEVTAKGGAAAEGGAPPPRARGWACAAWAGGAGGGTAV